MRDRVAQHVVVELDGLQDRLERAPDRDYLWIDDHWRLMAVEPSGLPIIVILEPRAHHDGPADLPDDLAEGMRRG